MVVFNTTMWKWPTLSRTSGTFLANARAAIVNRRLRESNHLVYFKSMGRNTGYIPIKSDDSGLVTTSESQSLGNVASHTVLLGEKWTLYKSKG